MAWNTSLGIRSLQGVEAELYLTTMQGAVDYSEVMGDDLDVKTGDRIFDFASFHQLANPSGLAKQHALRISIYGKKLLMLLLIEFSGIGISK